MNLPLMHTFTPIAAFCCLVFSSLLHISFASPLASTRNQSLVLRADSGISSGGKVGLGWPNGPDTSLKNFITKNTGALYTWGPTCPDNSPLPCYHMLWGDKQTADFDKAVKGAPGKSNVILGFNEPNQAGQSDMTAQHGCELWKQHIQPKKAAGYTLVSPATTSAPYGMTWMKDFMKCCTGCTIDAVAVHWYGLDADAFIKYLEQWHNAFKKPILVTEYAVQDFGGGKQATLDEINAFHKKVGPYMLKQSWVAKFFPFGFMHDMNNVNPKNQLMDAKGNPTPLGKMIINNAY